MWSVDARSDCHGFASEVSQHVFNQHKDHHFILDNEHMPARSTSLRREGIVMDKLLSGRQAIALIDAQVFDAAMLDMNLNGTKSHSVADALAAHGVPFIFSTGYSGHDMRDGYSDRPVLKKPFDNGALVEILTHLLSSHAHAHGMSRAS